MTLFNDSDVGSIVNELSFDNFSTVGKAKSTSAHCICVAEPPCNAGKAEPLINGIDISGKFEVNFELCSSVNEGTYIFSALDSAVSSAVFEDCMFNVNVDIDVGAGDVKVTGYSIAETTIIGESFGKDAVETLHNRLSLKTT